MIRNANGVPVNEDRKLNITAATGLTVSGDPPTLALDVPSLTADATPALTDYVPVVKAATGAKRKMSLNSVLLGGANISATYDLYDTPRTQYVWTKRTGVVLVAVTLIGGGGAGGNGGASGTTSGTGGGGGGGGGAVYIHLPAEVFGATTYVHVGVGGNPTPPDIGGMNIVASPSDGEATYMAPMVLNGFIGAQGGSAGADGGNGGGLGGYGGSTAANQWESQYWTGGDGGNSFSTSGANHVEGGVGTGGAGGGGPGAGYSTSGTTINHGLDGGCSAFQRGGYRTTAVSPPARGGGGAASNGADGADGVDSVTIFIPGEGGGGGGAVDNATLGKKGGNGAWPGGGGGGGGAVEFPNTSGVGGFGAEGGALLVSFY